MAACDIPTPGADTTPPPPPIDDSYEDSCSICLDHFTVQDPATVTNCRHEYHLQCILDWCQRSKECPICWQLLSLKDQSSQELLVAVEAERHSRLTTRSRPASTTRPYLFEHFDVEQDSYSDDDSDFDERIGQHLAAAVYRARQLQRRDRSPPRHGTSRVFVYASNAGFRNDQQSSPGGSSLSPGSSGAASPTSPMPPSLSNLHSAENLVANDNQEGLFRNSLLSLWDGRIFFGQSQTDNHDEPGSSRVLSLSDSIKSKWVAASSKYKESISKGTQGIKEKLLARNSSVKELSKGVQREMSAGIAGVARMIDRLELSSKRNNGGSTSPIFGEASSLCFKGKAVEDNSLARAFEKEERLEDARINGANPAPCHPQATHVQMGH
ncbi:E3 ubiquitin-protein ligase RHF1A [Linum perenne]